MPTVVTTLMPRSAEFGERPRIVHVRTSPRKSSTYEVLARGSLVSPNPARCSGVSNEHGSTPSSRTSCGRGGSATPVGAEGVPSTAVVQPAASTQATRGSTRRTRRR